MSGRAKKSGRLVTDIINDIPFLWLREAYGWDRADLVLIREALTALIYSEGYRSLGVDLINLLELPSGFFGMLYEMWEGGNVSIYLTNPGPKVQNYLWFKMFFSANNDVVAGDCYKFHNPEYGFQAPPGEKTAAHVPTLTYHGILTSGHPDLVSHAESEAILSGYPSFFQLQKKQKKGKNKKKVKKK